MKERRRKNDQDGQDSLWICRMRDSYMIGMIGCAGMICMIRKEGSLRSHFRFAKILFFILHILPRPKGAIMHIM